MKQESVNTTGVLLDNRLETKFQDAKPLYRESEARIEANRCLFCFDAPCIRACPAEIDIPAFIRKIASGNIRGSAQTIFRSNLLGVSTARVCPVEELCSGACVLNELNGKSVQIGRLQRFATEKAIQLEHYGGRELFTPKPATGKRVALIGAGPASVSCATSLALEGVESVIFERDRLSGGLNTTGIAPYKLPVADALAEIDWLLANDVEIRFGVEVGKDISPGQLLNEFDAVFLGTGLGVDLALGIPGEDCPGVWGATDLIRRIKLEPEFALPEDLHKVIVIGGGNTAIDIARELAMLGAGEVDILYRRTEAEMPGYAHELTAARANGVRLLEHLRPVEIQHDHQLILSAENTISGERLKFNCDWLVVAIGQEKIAGKIFNGVETDEKGCVKVDDRRRTSLPKIYAGGDCVNGGKEVVNAVADGREAAFSMLREWGFQPEQQQKKEI